MKGIKAGSIILLDESWAGDGIKHYAEITKVVSGDYVTVKTFLDVHGKKNWAASHKYILRVVSE